MTAKKATTKADLQEIVRQQAGDYEILSERLAELELAAEDESWIRLGFDGERELSRSGLRNITRLARLMFLKNPLIRRAVLVQGYYVWGQGVSAQARDPRINEVVQAFLDDPDNRKEFTNHQSRTSKEHMLQVEGNIFFACFVDQITGRVRVRSFVCNEVEDIVTNPDDAKEPWFYKRIWTQRSISPTGDSTTTTQQVAYYPDWRYRPQGGYPSTIGGKQVIQDVWVYHIKVGGLEDMRFGVPDIYAAMDWARAYKNYLEDWASIVKSLQRWAWKLGTKGGTRAVAAAKTKLETTVGSSQGESNPAPTTGSMFVEGAGIDLKPISKSGANVNAEDGKMLRLMVASATDIPDTILSNDPQQGALATAKTLDRPTELAMLDRQTLWSDVWQDFCAFAIEWAVIAPGGKLQGELVNDAGGVRRIRIFPEIGADADEEVDTTVDISFPSILEHDIKESVDAIVSASTLDGKPRGATLPPRLVSRLLLVALGVDSVDEIVDEMYPPDGEPIADDEEQSAEQLSIERMLAEATRDLQGVARAALQVKVDHGN